jgi:alpha-1,2-mannosyltransferase
MGPWCWHGNHFADRLHPPSPCLQVWVDTVGYAMPYPLVATTGAKIVAYVHYPTMSTDMLSRVSSRSTTFNNSSSISASALKSILKLVYYHLFAMMYGWLGAFPHVVMVNSSWTLGHIRSLWWRRWAAPACIVYPPCDVSVLVELPLEKPRETIFLCSIAQFRPEKNHRCGLAFGAWYAYLLCIAGLDGACHACLGDTWW